MVLKPACQGSSVGLQFVERVEQWPAALAESRRHGAEILVEEKICGRETTVGILAGEPLPVVEIRPRSGVYDYQSKYSAGASDYFCPAPFDAAVTARVQAAGLAAFRAIGGRDYARVDVMVRADGQPLVLEVNSLPGMTEDEVYYPKGGGGGAGLDFTGLCQRMSGSRLALDRAAATAH